MQGLHTHFRVGITLRKGQENNDCVRESILCKFSWVQSTGAFATADWLILDSLNASRLYQGWLGYIATKTSKSAKSRDVSMKTRTFSYLRNVPIL